MKTGRFIILLAVAALCAGCFKDVSYKTTYVLKPLSQASSGETAVPLEGAKAFAYNVDTTFWEVVSYEDALAGIISPKDNASEKMTTPAATAEPYPQEGAVGWLQMKLGKPSQMVVVVDPVSRIYGYTQQELAENLPKLYVSVVFKPWKEAKYFKDGVWSFVNQFYEPPVYTDCYLVPSVQETEQGPVTTPASLTVYAFAADTTSWRIASYDDAVAHTITSKEDPAQTRTKIDFEGFREQSTGRYGLKVSSTPLMLVAVDTTHKLYAYSQQEVTLGGEAVEFPLVFRLWQTQYITVEEPGGWRVVNEANAPQPEPESTSKR